MFDNSRKNQQTCMFSQIRTLKRLIFFGCSPTRTSTKRMRLAKEMMWLCACYTVRSTIMLTKMILLMLVLGFVATRPILCLALILHIRERRRSSSSPREAVHSPIKFCSLSCASHMWPKRGCPRIFDIMSLPHWIITSGVQQRYHGSFEDCHSRHNWPT